MIEDVLKRLAIVVAAVLTFIFCFYKFGNEYRNLHHLIYDQLAPLSIDYAADDGASLRFVFVDVDIDTYQAWGEPPVTPRDKLVQLLTALEDRARGAKAIIVDIDTSYSDDGDRGAASGDELLRRWAESYKREPPIILARYLDRPKADGGEGNMVPQSSFLDDIVQPGLSAGTDLSGGLHWAAPSFIKSGAHRLVRSGSLWKDVCYRGQPLVMPSVQLLTLLAISERRSDLARAFTAHLAVGQPESCDGSRASIAAGERLLAPRDGVEIDLGDNWRSRQILFSIKPLEDEGETEPGPAPSARPEFVKRQPAHRLADLSPDYFDDRIVVVGASHPQARDLHQTPLGTMSGSMVIINAIQSLHTLGTIAEPATSKRLTAVAALVLFLAVVLVLVHPIIAPYVASIAVASTTAVLFLSTPSYGLWLDMALAGALFLLVHTIFERLADLLCWWRSGRQMLNPDLQSLRRSPLQPAEPPR